MPSGAGSGVIESFTFTPDGDGKLYITAGYDVHGSGSSDWGPSYKSRLFCTQNGVTTYSNNRSASNARQSQSIVSLFNVVGGLECTVGLHGLISGAVACSWHEVILTIELFKRAA